MWKPAEMKKKITKNKNRPEKKIFSGRFVDIFAF